MGLVPETDFQSLLDRASKITGSPRFAVPKSAPPVNLSPDEDLAIRTIIGEAKGEGAKGWEGVADVIRNRSKGSGKRFSDVVLAPGQFEPWSSRRKELEAYDPNSPIFQQVARITLPVLRGERRGPAGDATHFYGPKSQAALGRRPPSWDNGKGIDIGNHRFFNLGYSGKGVHGTEPDVDYDDLLERASKITQGVDNSPQIDYNDLLNRAAQLTGTTSALPEIIIPERIPENERMPESAPHPVPETPDTLEAQKIAASTPKNPRFAVLTTEVEQNALFADGNWTAVPQENGKTLWVHTARAKKELKLKDARHINTFVQKNPRAMATLIGKIDDVGDQTDRGVAVSTLDPQTGTELTSSIVTNPDSAQKQVAVDQASFPGAESVITDPQAVVAQRVEKGAVLPPPVEKPLRPAIAAKPAETPAIAPETGQKQPVQDYSDDSGVIKPFTRTVSFAGKPEDVSESEWIIQTLVPEIASTTGLAAADIDRELRSKGGPRLASGSSLGGPAADIEIDEQFLDAVAERGVQKRANLGQFIESGREIDPEAISKQEGIDPQEIKDVLAGKYPEYQAALDKGKTAKAQHDKLYADNLANSKDEYTAKVLAEQQMGWRDDADKESKAYWKWAQESGFDSDEYRRTHSKELVRAKNEILDTYGSFAAMEKQKGEDEQYYKDKPFLKLASKVPPLFGNETMAKDTSLRNQYRNRARLSDEEIENAESLGRGARAYIEAAGWKPSTLKAGEAGFGVGLGSDLANLGAGLLRYGQPVLDWASGGKGSDWLERAAEQTRLFGETARPESGASRTAFAVGEGVGTLPGIMGATILAGGNPVLGFALHAAVTSTGKPVEEQSTNIAKSAVLGLIFEGVPFLGKGAGSLFESAVKKAGLDATAKPTQLIQTLLEKGVRIGTVTGIGAGQAAVEGGDAAQITESAITMALMELGMQTFGHKPTRHEWHKLDKKVLTLPNENGKPRDVLLTKSEDGIEITDVTGLVPEGVQQAVIGPRQIRKVGEETLPPLVPEKPKTPFEDALAEGRAEGVKQEAAAEAEKRSTPFTDAIEAGRAERAVKNEVPEVEAEIEGSRSAPVKKDAYEVGDYVLTGRGHEGPIIEVYKDLQGNQAYRYHKRASNSEAELAREEIAGVFKPGDIEPGSFADKVAQYSKEAGKPKTPEAQTEEAVAPGVFAKNKIITVDKVQEAREVLKKSSTKFNTGLDPTELKALSTIGAAYVEAGARKFADFSTQMVKDFGEKIIPHLERLYGAIRDEHRFDGMDQGVSAVGKSIERKAIEKGLSRAFDETAGYDKITVKEQAEKMAELLADENRIKNIISGAEKLPSDIRGGSFIKAVEDHALAKGDVQMLQDLAKSKLTAETSLHAQEMRMLAERDPDSVVAKLQEIKKAREAVVQKRLGRKQTIQDAQGKEVEGMRAEIKKTVNKRQNWSEFIKSISCGY